MKEGFEAFLINPPRKRGKKTKARKIKMARRRTKSGRFAKTRSRRVSANPRRRRSARRSYRNNPGMSELMLLNPPRKRRGRPRVRKSTLRSRARKYGRRISRGLSFAGILPTLKEGAMLGIGAIVVNNLHMRFVPDSLKADKFMSFAARAGISVAGGMLISKFIGQKFGQAFALGGVAYSVMVLANQSFPEYAPLGGLEEYYASVGMGDYYTPKSLPETMQAQPDGLNWEAGIPERLSPANRF